MRIILIRMVDRGHAQVNEQDGQLRGFQNAAELYQDRAAYRVELALYGALPISVLFLGQMIIWQVAPLMRALVQMMNALGDSGG